MLTLLKLIYPVTKSSYQTTRAAFDANVVQNNFCVTWTDLSIVSQSYTMVKIWYNRHFTYLRRRGLTFGHRIQHLYSTRV